jgi:hypothetical protein
MEAKTSKAKEISAPRAFSFQTRPPSPRNQRELHPLKSSAFPRRTFSLISGPKPHQSEMFGRHAVHPRASCAPALQAIHLCSEVLGESRSI